MKNGTIAALLLVAVFKAFPVQGRLQELSAIPVSKSLYVIKGAGCNVVLWVTDEGLLLADSGERPGMGSEIMAKVRELSYQSVRYLVFTHYHHIIGAEEFLPSATVMAHARTRDNIPLYRRTLTDLFDKSIHELEVKAGTLKSARVAELKKVQAQLALRKKQRKDIERQRDILPQVTFETKVTIHLGSRTAELLHFGPGHTNGDVIIYFPEEKAAYVGDLLYTNGWVPRLDGDAGCSSANWLKIFGLIGRLDVEKIVPGHGDVTDLEGFLRISKVFADYLMDLRAEVHKRIARGDSLERIKAEMTLPKYRHMGMADTLLPWNIEGAYREILAAKGLKQP